MTFKDAKTGILLYFESDGQSVAGIDKDGKILWHKNPARDAKLKGFTKDDKSVRPVIIRLSSPGDTLIKDMKRRGLNGDFIWVSFSTGEAGVLDEQTGAITILGKN